MAGPNWWMRKPQHWDAQLPRIEDFDSIADWEAAMQGLAEDTSDPIGIYYDPIAGVQRGGATTEEQRAIRMLNSMVNSASGPGPDITVRLQSWVANNPELAQLAYSAVNADGTSPIDPAVLAMLEFLGITGTPYEHPAETKGDPGAVRQDVGATGEKPRKGGGPDASPPHRHAPINIQSAMDALRDAGLRGGRSTGGGDFPAMDLNDPWIQEIIARGLTGGVDQEMNRFWPGDYPPGGQQPMPGSVVGGGSGQQGTGSQKFDPRPAPVYGNPVGNHPNPPGMGRAPVDDEFSAPPSAVNVPLSAYPSFVQRYIRIHPQGRMMPPTPPGY